MVKGKEQSKTHLIKRLIEGNTLFRGLEEDFLRVHLEPDRLKLETLFSNRPVYTAFLPNDSLEELYLILEEGLIIIRSTPLDRIIAINYPGGCFGMRNLPFSYGMASRAFPSLVEAYKTTQVVKISLETIERLYNASPLFQERYRLLFELRVKFEYHLLNCSNYPPQAVAALLRGLIYQERELGNQKEAPDKYTFDLPIDVIARACQLNQRTVEQVIKGMQQVGLLAPPKNKDYSGDLITVIDAEILKGVYSATRDKVDWWPLK